MWHQSKAALIQSPGETFTDDNVGRGDSSQRGQKLKNCPAAATIWTLE